MPCQGFKGELLKQEFLQAVWLLSCHPTNSVKALEGILTVSTVLYFIGITFLYMFW